MYAVIYKWFTETSGQGVVEQSMKLVYHDQAKREDQIAETIEAWKEKCIRLASYASEHELATVYNMAALKKILVGEALRNYVVWKPEGMPYCVSTNS